MKRSSLAVIFLILITGITSLPVFADSTLYSNGPVSTAYFGDAFYLGAAISNSFTLTQNSTITGIDFVVDSGTPYPMASVDWSISSAPFGGTSITAVTTNQFLATIPGDDSDTIYNETISFSNLSLAAGIYYLTLQNAVSTNGIQPVWWSESSGPSISYQEFIETDPFGPPSSGPLLLPASQAFDVIGNVNNSPEATPEPSSFLLLGSGLAGVASMIRHKIRV